MRAIAFYVRDEEEEIFTSMDKKYECETRQIKEPLSEENLQLIEGYSNVSILGGIHLDDSIMKRLSDMGVKNLVTRSIGWDIMDVSAAKKHGINVSNISYSPYSVAEYALLQILLATRKMGMLLGRLKTRDYRIEDLQGREIWDMTVGIVGTGKIGKALIDLLTGFHANILAYDLYPDKDLKNVTYTDLDTLLKKSDIISVHIPSTKENLGLFSKETFDKCRDGVIFINTARGDLVVTADLIDALKRGKIGAAGLDVLAEELPVFRFDHKGVPDKNPMITQLENMENVFLTPHIAFNTSQALYQVVENTFKSLLLFEKGEKNPWQLN